MLSHFSHVQLCVTCQDPLSMAFPRQEHWSGLPFPSPGDLPDPGIRPASLMSLALSGQFSTTSITNQWEQHICKQNKNEQMTCTCMVNSHKKVFSLFSHQGNMNYNQIEILLYWYILTSKYCHLDFSFLSRTSLCV